MLNVHGLTLPIHKLEVIRALEALSILVAGVAILRLGHTEVAVAEEEVRFTGAASAVVILGTVWIHACACLAQLISCFALGAFFVTCLVAVHVFTRPVYKQQSIFAISAVSIVKVEKEAAGDKDHAASKGGKILRRTHNTRWAFICYTVGCVYVNAS